MDHQHLSEPMAVVERPAMMYSCAKPAKLIEFQDDEIPEGYQPALVYLWNMLLHAYHNLVFLTSWWETTP